MAPLGKLPDHGFLFYQSSWHNLLEYPPKQIGEFEFVVDNKDAETGLGFQ